MDMHIKFRLHIQEFNKYTRDYAINLEDEFNEEIFSLSEYSKCELELIYISPRYKILVDTYQGSLIHCGINELIDITNNDDSEKLLPGYYEIKVLDSLNNKSIRSLYYKISTKNLSFKQLDNMKEYLNKYVKGIDINYHLSREYIYNKGSNILKDFEQRLKIWEDIKPTINSIISNPPYILNKNYKKSRICKNIDHRVMKRLEMTGRNLNDLMYRPQVCINYNTEDNNYLLQALIATFDELSLELNKYVDFLLCENSKLIDIDRQYNEKVIEYNKIKFDKFISNESKKGTYSRIAYLSKEKDNCINKINNINNIICIIKTIKNDISIIVDKFNNIGIDSNIMSYRIKNQKYIHIIEKLDKNLKCSDLSSKNKRELAFTFKKTETLFEYFCYFRVVQALLDLDFQPEDGWVKEAFNNKFDFEIPSESRSSFISGDLKLILIYDCECPEVPIDYESKYEGLVSMNSKHRRPDITILMYRNNVFLKSIIFEVKCRNSRYIYNSNGDTEVVKTMKDYMQLWYYNEAESAGAVEKVILLYPMQKNIIDVGESFINKFKFIPIDIDSFEVEEGIHNNIIEFLDN